MTKLWALLSLILAFLCVPAAGGTKVLLTQEEALALAFPDCQVERKTIYLTAEQRRRIAELAKVDCEISIAYAYVATKAGKLVGTAYFDTHRVRTLKQSLMVVVGFDQKLQRLELLAFAEPAEYQPRPSFYAQFLKKALDDELQLKRGLKSIAGATLSARATTSAARRVLALHQVVQLPPPVQSGSQRP